MLIKWVQANARALELAGIAAHNPTPENQARAERARRKVLRLTNKLSEVGVFLTTDWS